jgi:mono/diheme cytochrome c family protein
MPIRSSFFALAVAMPSGAEPDSRAQVELPSPMREHMLTNMRDHLLAIETIVRLLAEGRYGEAADTAEERLGLGAMQTHGGHHMAPYMPEGMRAIGRAMHRAASRLALGARDAEVRGDLAGPLTGPAEVMQQCVACHAAYRVH